jgi:hypothetical protein
MLVIDGKYSSGDGRIKRIKIPWGFRRESSGGTAVKKTRAAKAKLKIQEFAEEKEDRDSQPQDLIQISRKNEGLQIRQKLQGRYTIGKSQGEIPT